MPESKRSRTANRGCPSLQHVRSSEFAAARAAIRACLCWFLILAGATGVGAGATRQQILHLVTPLAAALSEGDAGAFMAEIPEDVPDRETLAANVEGLLAAAIVTSSVAVIEITSREARLEWYMEIKSRATGTVVERRRQIVSIQLGRSDQLMAIQPVRVFRPPGLQAN